MKKNSAHYNHSLQHYLRAVSLAWVVGVGGLLGLVTLTESALAADVAAQLKAAEKAIRVQDFSRGFSLYLAVAKTGDPEAQYQLSNLYTLGSGTQTDHDVALQWLEKSAAQNYPPALYQLAVVQAKDNPKRAQALMLRAAEYDYPAARQYLKHRRGADVFVEVTQDDDQGSLWFGAARKNDTQTLAQLLTGGVDVNATDSAGRTALFVAVESQSFEAVNFLLDNGADIHHLNDVGSSVLFIATGLDDAHMLKRLIRAGGDTDLRLSNGDNLLHHAIRVKALSLVPLLLTSKVNLNQENKAGWTPLDLAQYKEYAAISSQLEAQDAVHGRAWINQIRDSAKTTASQFIRAKGSAPVTAEEVAKMIYSGNPLLVEKMIVDYPELLNEQLSDGTTLLNIATAENDSDMVTRLLAHPVEVDQPGSGGVTALHIASRKGYLDIVKVLLAAEANPLQPDHEGLDAIASAIQQRQDAVALVLLKHRGLNVKPAYEKYFLSAAKQNMATVVQYLLPKVNTEVADKLERNVVWYAAYHQNIPLLKRLSGVAGKNKPDFQGKTPLFVAAEKKCTECVRLLVSDASVNVASAAGDTPLIVAAATGDDEIVSCLIDHGADIEARNALGNTALIVATENHALTVVKQLVAAKVVVGRKNTLGFSALDIAERKDQAIYSYLKEQSLLGIF